MGLDSVYLYYLINNNKTLILGKRERYGHRLGGKEAVEFWDTAGKRTRVTSKLYTHLHIRIINSLAFYCRMLHSPPFFPF